jgi:hypothetical protein
MLAGPKGLAHPIPHRYIPYWAQWHVPGMFDNVMDFMICAMAMWIWARGMWI